MISQSFGILHLSDLHFGRISPHILHDLEDFISSRKEEINLVILTGDVTQRAKHSEFREAKEFLETIKSPLFLVPGNHDIPLYNLFHRFINPYGKFHRYLGHLAANFYEDDQFVIYGLWTANNYAAQAGHLSSNDLANLEEKFQNAPAHKVKIIASHHPLFSLKQKNLESRINRMLSLDPDLVLWGHEHKANITTFDEERKFPLLISSGTSTSSRTRNEANSFNFLKFDGDEFSMDIFHHLDEKSSFEVSKHFTVSIPKKQIQ